MSTILERFHEKFPKSQKLYFEGKEVVAGGAAQSRVMHPYPVYISHAKGATKFDVDGNEIIDYVIGFGSLILGNSHPAITEAVTTQLEKELIMAVFRS